MTQARGICVACAIMRDDQESRPVATPLINSPIHTNSGHRSYVINKFTCRQEFRSDATKNPFSHDQVCLFYHFLSEIKQHTTGAEFQELTPRFLHGYINKDLNAQATAMDESLTLEDFNFMARLQKVDEASLAQKEVQSEEKELSLAIAHMAQDREAVKLHWAALKKHRNKSRSDTYEASHDADAIITKHAEAHTALHIPVNIVRPDALAAHVSDHVSTWAGKMEIPVSQVLQMYVAPLDKLGLHWHANWHKLSADISGFIAADPINAAAFVSSPLVGKITDQYCYDKIREAEREIEARLNEVDLEMAPGMSLFGPIRHQSIKIPITVAISLLGWSSVPEGMMQVLSSAVGPRATCTNVRSL